MKKIIILTMVFIIFTIMSAWATIIIIPEDYQTIQEGIDVSNNGDTVLVKPDIYFENINFDGHNITVGSLFLTTGDTLHIPVTIIDGNYDGTVVTFESGESRAAIIIGFTIQGGGSEPGGAIYCWYSSPTITHNIIAGNEAHEGGGIHCYLSNPIIINNKVTKNFAFRGGGIYCNYSNPTILSNIIFANTAIGNGGGINCNNSSPTVSNNRIKMNSAVIGGGFYCQMFSNPIISNNIISINIARKGGGILCLSNSNPNIINNTLSQNMADNLGGGIYCKDSSPVAINTIIWANIAFEEGSQIYIESGDPIFTYCDIEGGWPNEGNIEVYPIYRDSASGNHHLMSTYCGDPYDSPCIDVGCPAILDSVLDCDWGLGELRSDMGAYGGINYQMDIDDQKLEVPDQFILEQNYPNPFNAVTIIRHTLPKASNVTIEIYDILGRKVETLVNEYKQAGTYKLGFDASELSSGIYFYRLQAGDFSESKGMILLK